MTDYLEAEFTKIRTELRRNELEVERLRFYLELILTRCESGMSLNEKGVSRLAMCALRRDEGEQVCDDEEVLRGMLAKEETL